MRPNLVKATDETSARARADRSLQSGRVVSVDTTTNTAILDVGMVDFNGNAVYLHDVPFSPQSPPQVQDTVAILRTSSSPYSCVVGSGAQVGGANSGQIVQAGGAVTSMRKSGEGSGQQGDIILAAGTGISVLRANKTFSIGLSDTGVVPGAYTDVNLTVDATGRVIDISNGSGGGGGGPSGFAPSNMHFVTTQAESALSNEFSLGSLASGMLKHAVSTGVSTPATATLGTDYAGAPDGSTLETSGSTTRIKDAGVTLAKLVNIADQTILGNNTGGAAAPLALTAAQVRTLLALVIGTNVQAWDADLDALAALTATTNNFIQSKSSAWASRTPTQVTADLIAFIGDSGSGGTKGMVPAPASGDAAAGKYLKADGTWTTVSGAAGGTVTSVGLSLPAELTVSGSPVTGSGTLAAVWANETTNKVLAAPNGSTGTPTFRALAAADIPAIAESGVTGLVADLAAKLAIASNLSDLASAATARTNLGVAVHAIPIGLNNGTSALVAGQYMDFVAEYAFTINQVTMLADQSGSVVLDLRKCTYAQFDDSAHPVSGDSICASAKPTISSAAKSQDNTLMGWTTSVSAGDVIRVYVVSATGITQVTLSLKVTRA